MRKVLSLLACLPLVFTVAFSQEPAAAPENPSVAMRMAAKTQADAEIRAARAYQNAVKAGPLALRAYLADFPKGADLHVHLSGAVYAETLLRDAGEDGLCVDPAALAFAKPPCAEPLVSADAVLSNQSLYDRLIDAFSMRAFVATAGESGHDHFFATFGRFGGLKKSHNGEWVDEAAARAAAQNQQYLELMLTPPFGHAVELMRQTGERIAPEFSGKEFARLRQTLLDRGLREEVAVGLDEIAEAESDRQQREHCSGAGAQPGCAVEVRYLYQILRAEPPEQVFAQMLLGFETVAESQRQDREGQGGGRFVGVNLVQPEDSYVAMRDYSLQMRMLDYLHSVYPGVHISLHAGELALGLVPPEGLRAHVREAVEVGRAERIGHGVDVMYENDANDLLAEMARKHVMVEINLSSNEGILGVAGQQHPFALYRAAHTPVALSTDDEGVSRIDLTTEYVRAARDYNLSYRDLKTLARTGLEHSFLPGESLWPAPDAFNVFVESCRKDTPGASAISTECGGYIEKNQKARQQWELERRFHAFEGKF